MPRIQYIEDNFKPATREIIDLANEVLNNYSAQGFVLTVRQLYYQFIGQDLFPESWVDDVYNAKHHLQPGTKNTTKNYKRLGAIVNNGRLAGLIDWGHMEDRLRELEEASHWRSPEDLVQSAAAQYRRNLWDDQDYRPEIWVEKDALSGVLDGVCKELDVPYFVCRGYASQSSMWESGQRIIRHADGEQTPVIFYLGDHDPSGLDMPRDIQERLDLFTNEAVKVLPIAMTMAQVEQYDCPPNPAKMTDSRAGAYVALHGYDSWELDALEPSVIVDLVRKAIDGVRDVDRFDAAKAVQETEREQLTGASEDWDGVTEYLGLD